MNKADLVTRIARESGLTKADSLRALDAFTALVMRALKKGVRVKIAGFGTFGISRRKARVVLNPKSKAPVKIPSRRAPRFAPSKELKAMLASSFAEGSSLNRDGRARPRSRARVRARERPS